MSWCHFSPPIVQTAASIRNILAEFHWLDAHVPTKGLFFVRRNWIYGQAVSIVSSNKKECNNRRDCQVSQVILREGRQDSRIV